MSASVRVPAEVFHPAQIIADECLARGWNIWDFAERIGALDEQVTVLAYMLYAHCASNAEMCASCLPGDIPMDMERVLGINAEVWRRTHQLTRDYPDRVQPLTPEAIEWYEFADEPAPAPQQEQPAE